MRKFALVLALWIMLANCFSMTFPLREDAETDCADRGATAFVLPVSLVSIAEEAFEGTTAETVVLSDSVITIGERAFADNSRLKMISIPESVIYIGNHAFEGAPNLMIEGAKGSYAEHWAQDHSVLFTAKESVSAWHISLRRLVRENAFLAFGLCFICPGITLRRRRKMLDVWRSLRPQDRAELYPINYRFP